MEADYKSPTESTEEQLRALQAYGEPTRAAIAAGILPQAQTQYEADAAVSPKYAELQARLAEKYGPRLGEIGRELSRQEQLGASRTEQEIAETVGPGLVNSALNLQKILDPGAEKLREQVAAGQSKLIEGYDPNTLSAFEREEINRNAAQNKGFVNPASVTDTVQNAMTTGNRLNERRRNFSDILGSAAGTIPATRSGMSGFEVATRRTLTPNWGTGTYQGAATGLGKDAINIGSSVFDHAGNYAQKSQKKKTIADTVGQWANTVSDLTSSVTSFI